MSEYYHWLVAIFLTVAVVGINIRYQGKVLLMKPEDREKLGKRMRCVGEAVILFAGIGVIIVLAISL